jgi:hypothetical protein
VPSFGKPTTGKLQGLEPCYHDMPALELRVPRLRKCCSGLVSRRLAKMRMLNTQTSLPSRRDRAPLLVGPVPVPVSPRGRLWSQTGRSASQSQQSCPLAHTRPNVSRPLDGKCPAVELIGQAEAIKYKRPGDGATSAGSCGCGQEGGACEPKERNATQRVVRCQAAAW